MREQLLTERSTKLDLLLLRGDEVAGRDAELLSLARLTAKGVAALSSSAEEKAVRAL